MSIQTHPKFTRKLNENESLYNSTPILHSYSRMGPSVLPIDAKNPTLISRMASPITFSFCHAGIFKRATASRFNSRSTSRTHLPNSWGLYIQARDSLHKGKGVKDFYRDFMGVSFNAAFDTICVRRLSEMDPNRPETVPDHSQTLPLHFWWPYILENVWNQIAWNVARPEN